VITGQLGSLAGFPADALLWLSIAGVIHFVWGRYCNYRATKAIGGNLAGPVHQVNLVLALALAIVFLGETLNPLKVLGIALIVIGALVAAQARPAKPAPQPKMSEGKANATIAFEPKYIEGYGFALLSAVAYGTSPVFIRKALEDATIGASIGGGLISYAAAALVIALILTLPNQLRHAQSIPWDSAKWFAVSGFLVFWSQMFRYAALAIAPVTVVAPIQATSPAFRVLFGWLINRQHEIFGAWLVLGVVISMLGVVSLSLSIDLVLSRLPSSSVLVDLANWQWP
jgi:drug/metabolite transporter (DMT)-like permease